MGGVVVVLDNCGSSLLVIMEESFIVRGTGVVVLVVRAFEFIIVDTVDTWVRRRGIIECEPPTVLLLFMLLLQSGDEGQKNLLLGNTSVVSLLLLPRQIDSSCLVPHEMFQFLFLLVL